MKKCILTIAISCSALAATAQNGPKNIYAATTTPVISTLPSERCSVGGTTITADYVGGNITKTMEGAFEYACRLWEERIPTTLPLRIKVQVASLGSNVLATSDPVYSDISPNWERAFEKRVLQRYNLYDIEDVQYFEKEDVVITFNYDMPFSYSTDPEQAVDDKYDFITVAIQAIGKAIGIIYWAYYNGTRPICLKNNPYAVYVNSANSQLSSYQTAIGNGWNAIIGGYDGTDWPLYCPLPYNPGLALNYFAPDTSNSETQFMQPVISKGTAIRHIGRSLDDLLRRCNWFYDYGVSTGSIYNEPTVEILPSEVDSVIPYAGNNASLPNRYDAAGKHISRDGTHEDSLLALQYFYSSCKERSGTGRSVLLKDGSFRDFDSLSELLPSDTTYARSTDGFLRLKTNTIEENGNSSTLTVKYQLYRFPPQKPDFGFNRTETSNSTNRAAVLRNSRGRVSRNGNRIEDEYVDIALGIKNLEGCTQVLVEQTDSDWPYPYTYYLEQDEILAGEFMTQVNRPYPSTFKLYYINNEGYTESDVKTIDLSGVQMTSGMQYSLEVIPGNSVLQYSLASDDGSNTDSLQGCYTITNANTGIVTQEGSISAASGRIDVSALPAGVYLITIQTGSQTLSAKWVKR